MGEEVNEAANVEHAEQWQAAMDEAVTPLAQDAAPLDEAALLAEQQERARAARAELHRISAAGDRFWADAHRFNQ